MSTNPHRSRGFTLIEVIVTIVVVGIASVALMSVFTNTISGSADPVIQQQATTIAEAYLEEISLRSFNDPDDPESGTDEGEAGRALYDDVKDYRSLGVGAPADQFGVAIPSLADYTVTVTITDAALGTVPATDSLRIEVEVDHPAVNAVTVAGFRTNY